jgi:ADP-ribose pyrophosphatase
MLPGSAPPAWRVESSETIAQHSAFSVRRDRTRDPRSGVLHAFEIAVSAEGVAVVAVTEEDELLLVRQFRHGTGAVTLELPSGIIDPGEDPLEGGLRELREETGWAGGEARYLGVITVNPAWQSTRVHIVRASGVRRAGEKDLDETEDTRVVCHPFSDVRRLVSDGAVDSAVAIAALALDRWSDGAGL